MKGVIPSVEFMEQIKRVVRESLRGERGLEDQYGRNRKKTVMPVVVLSEDLLAATDRFDDATIPSAVAYFVKKDTSTTWITDTATSITLFNRAENISYTSDTLGTYALILGKPCFMPLDCAPAASSSSSVV